MLCNLLLRMPPSPGLLHELCIIHRVLRFLSAESADTACTTLLYAEAQ